MSASEMNQNKVGWCAGKVPFQNRRLASEVARRRNRFGSKGDPYQCHECGQWHIGRSNLARYTRKS